MQRAGANEAPDQANRRARFMFRTRRTAERRETVRGGQAGALLSRDSLRVSVYQSKSLPSSDCARASDMYKGESTKQGVGRIRRCSMLKVGLETVIASLKSARTQFGEVASRPTTGHTSFAEEVVWPSRLWPSDFVPDYEDWAVSALIRAR